MSGIHGHWTPVGDPADGLLVRGVKLPLVLGDFRVIAFDMDSTLIASETVNELAELTGHKEQIEAMTRAAMQGTHVDFADNLRARMALLRGVPESLLAKVRDKHMPITHGVQNLLTVCRLHGLHCVLISGGFTYFADSLIERLGLDEIHANVLEIENGQLTGCVNSQPGKRFVDALGKCERLQEICDRLGVPLRQAIAVGDGANDVPMLEAAGLAVAFHSKQVLHSVANVRIDRGGLDRLLSLFTLR